MALGCIFPVHGLDGASLEYESLGIPMAVGGTRGMAVAQRAVPFAPLDGFNVAIHEDTVHHTIVTWNDKTGVVAPLVIRFLDRRIDELIMRGTFVHGDPLGGIQNAKSV